MITLKEFLEAGNHRVTEGNEYLWDCFGEHAYTMDVQVGGWDSSSAHIVFDRKTQEIYQASVYDYNHNRAYRLFGNESYKKAYETECERRNVNSREAWEHVEYTDLEVDRDFMSKMTAIMNEQDYDTKVSVPLDLDNDTLFQMMMMAHERDITLNKFVEEILENAINHAKDTVHE